MVGNIELCSWSHALDRWGPGHHCVVNCNGLVEVRQFKRPDGGVVVYGKPAKTLNRTWSRVQARLNRALQSGAGLTVDFVSTDGHQQATALLLAAEDYLQNIKSK